MYSNSKYSITYSISYHTHNPLFPSIQLTTTTDLAKRTLRFVLESPSTSLIQTQRIIPRLFLPTNLFHHVSFAYTGIHPSPHASNTLKHPLPVRPSVPFSILPFLLSDRTQQTRDVNIPSQAYSHSYPYSCPPATRSSPPRNPSADPARRV